METTKGVLSERDWSMDNNKVPHQISTNSFVADHYMHIVAEQVVNDICHGVSGVYNS